MERHKKTTSEARNSYLWCLHKEKVFQLHNEKKGFIIKGRAENVESVFNQAKVLVAPIPFGAGIKGKLLESMQFGLPNVTSAVGAEAMHGNLDWNGFITDNETEFVEKSSSTLPR